MNKMKSVKKRGRTTFLYRKGRGRRTLEKNRKKMRKKGQNRAK
jgi:hypothetical protein